MVFSCTIILSDQVIEAAGLKTQKGLKPNTASICAQQHCVETLVGYLDLICLHTSTDSQNLQVRSSPKNTS